MIKTWKRKENFENNPGHNILRNFEMFDKIFLLTQVKEAVLISNKYDIYEVPHELLNDLSLTISKKYETSRNLKAS